MEAATGGQVSSFELLPQCGLDLVLAHLPAARSPLGGRHEWQVLIEADTARPGDPLAAIVQQALADALEAGERSAEHTSELQPLMRISSAVLCLNTKKKQPS